MREFDKNGLLFAEYQAKIFEKSIDVFESSSPYFIMRYMKSDVLKELENRDPSLMAFDVDEAINSLASSFGHVKRGNVKYTKEEMFWIGYLYGYIMYTRKDSFYSIQKLIRPEELRERYYSYHTQSEEWCISTILEEKGETENRLNINKRIAKLLASRYE